MKTERIDLSTIKERILVVDDEPVVRTLLELQLHRLGLHADTAANGKQAAALLAGNDYGLAITDIEMPEMDGMELLSHIQDFHPDTDVLVTSGANMRHSFADIIEAGATDFIRKPFLGDELKAKLQRLFRERRLVADLAQVKVKEKSFFLHIVESLAITLDEKDRYTHGHSRRVTDLALQLAEQVTDEKVDYDLLRISAILHDIGKIGVPDKILTCPGELSEDQFEIIKKHPVQGAHILHPLKSDQRVAKISEVIKHHHECFDGTGYPSGIRGKAIPLLARIITIADSYDAMTSDRPYRQSLSPDKALAEIRSNAGSQFDPVLSRKFVKIIEESQEDTTCAHLQSCEIFLKITRNDALRAYKMQYCSANFRACVRYKTNKKEDNLRSLLPDGNFFQEHSQQAV